MSEGILYLLAFLALIAGYFAAAFWGAANWKSAAQYCFAVLFIVLASYVVFGILQSPQP